MYKLKLLIFPAAILAASVFLFFHYHLRAALSALFIPLIIGIEMIITDKSGEPVDGDAYTRDIIICLISLVAIGIVGASKTFG